jgi:hypothetical protein
MLRSSSPLTAAIVRSYLEEDLPESFRIFNPALVDRSLLGDARLALLQSMSSPGLLEVAAAAAGAIRFRNVEDLDCEILAMEVMPDHVHLFLN